MQPWSWVHSGGAFRTYDHPVLALHDLSVVQKHNLAGGIPTGLTRKTYRYPRMEILVEKYRYSKDLYTDEISHLRNPELIADRKRLLKEIGVIVEAIKLRYGLKNSDSA